MKNRKLWVSVLAGIMAFVLLFGLVAGILPSLVGAATKPSQSSSELKKQLEALKADKKKIDKEINKLEDQLSDNKSDMKAIVNRKDTIDQEIFMLYEQIQNMNDQIVTYGNLIADKQEELDAAQARLAELNEKHKERIRAMEEDGGLTYWSVLFKANSFADLLDRMNMIEEIAAADGRRLKQISDAAQEVADTKATLEEEVKGLEANKVELAESQVKLEAKREEADKLLAELVATGAEYQALLDEAEKEAGKLAADIKDTNNDYKDALTYEEWLATSKPGSSSSTSGAPASDGKWVLPCKYVKFTSPFGWRIHPVDKVRKFHQGVDLAAAKGTTIVASRSGTVVEATYNKSAGYYVKVDHGDGFASVYMHMTHYIVKVGDKVTAGQKLGEMGSTGKSTGPHLHFGILYKGQYVNPAKYINI